MKETMKKVLWGVGLSLLVLTPACSDNRDPSQTLVTDVEHSAVKRQSIGNCWLYATASWVESLHLAATQEELNTSESYWTWWHFYNQLTGYVGDKIATGGSWGQAHRIIDQHGVVLEGQFIADEAAQQMSRRQAQAEEYINEQLKEGGALATANDRTPEKVRAELDKAFGSNMAATEALAVSADQFVSGKTADGQVKYLSQSFDEWQELDYPRTYNEHVPLWVQRQRNAAMQRVLKALNDKNPVVMSIMIDFNGLDVHDATFKASLVRSSGAGRQGGHMLVLEDYAVDDVPGVGSIGEGDVSDDLKAKALTGTVRYLVAKNSWGTNRPDRGLTDGYTRFDSAYMNEPLGWKADGEEENSPISSYYSALGSFVVPAGY